MHWHRWQAASLERHFSLGCCPFPQRERDFSVGNGLGRFCLPCLLWLIKCTALRLVLLVHLRVRCCSCMSSLCRSSFLAFSRVSEASIYNFVIGDRVVFQLRVGRESCHLSLASSHRTIMYCLDVAPWSWFRRLKRVYL